MSLELIIARFSTIMGAVPTCCLIFGGTAWKTSKERMTFQIISASPLKKWHQTRLSVFIFLSSQFCPHDIPIFTMKYLPIQADMDINYGP